MAMVHFFNLVEHFCDFKLYQLKRLGVWSGMERKFEKCDNKPRVLWKLTKVSAKTFFWETISNLPEQWKGFRM